MLVLALESATDVAGVALADESGVLAVSAVGGGRRHGESLAPAAQFVCDRAGVGLEDLGALSVDVGPGLFTGLRVGVSTAKALAFALEVPVVEVGSLELLALAAAASPWALQATGTLVVPVVDARRAQLFASVFDLERSSDAVAGSAPLAVRVSPDRLYDPASLAADISSLVAGGRPCLCLGDGARRYAALLAEAGAVVGPGAPAPDAGVLGVVGVERARAGLGRDAAEVAARYLRPADVRIKWEKRMTVRPVAGS